MWHWRSQYGQADLQVIWAELKWHFTMKFLTVPLYIETVSEYSIGYQIIHLMKQRLRIIWYGLNRVVRYVE